MPKAKRRNPAQAGARGSGETPANTARDGGHAYGIELDDGTTYPLENQPPVAVSKGWGIVPGWWHR